MKGRVWAMTSALLLITALANPAAAELTEPSLASASEVIGPGKVHVRFKVRVLGVLSVMGRFDRLFGKFVTDSESGATGVRMQIETGSVSTDDEWRDGYLRGPTFFAADRYPHITFSGSCLSRGDNGAMQLAGNLSLRGRKRPVVFEFESPGRKPANDSGVYEARTVIRRSEFGLNAMEHLISDEVEIIVAMQTGSAD